MVKVARFQATALDAHVVVVGGSECLSSILKYYDEWLVLLLDHGIANMSLCSVVDKLLVGI